MTDWLDRAHRLFDRDPWMVAGYRSYGSAQRVLVRGRAMENEGITAATDTDSLWRNLVNSYRRIEADPLPNAVVRATVGGAVAEITADDEGFFSQWIDLPAPVESPDGWVPVTLELVAPSMPGVKVVSDAQLLLAPPTARFITISDMDDTVLQSHVTSLVQAFRTVLLGNARTRLPFPGVAAFYRALHAGSGGAEQNPIFYVSSSPWNIYDLLEDFLDVHGVPPGPLFLKDWSLSVLGKHRTHKLRMTPIPIIATTPPTSHSRYLVPAMVTCGRTSNTRFPMARRTRNSVGPNQPYDSLNTPMVYVAR